MLMGEKRIFDEDKEIQDNKEARKTFVKILVVSLMAFSLSWYLLFKGHIIFFYDFRDD